MTTQTCPDCENALPAWIVVELRVEYASSPIPVGVCAYCACVLLFVPSPLGVPSRGGRLTLETCDALDCDLGFYVRLLVDAVKANPGAHVPHDVRRLSL